VQHDCILSYRASPDKLSETKRREAEVKAALKEVRNNKKQEKQEQKAATAHEQKLQRIKEHPNSKRAQKDVRNMETREKRKSGQMCEHGVWKCKICFPHSKEK